MKTLYSVGFILAFSLIHNFISAQTSEKLIQNYLTEKTTEQGLSAKDIETWIITDDYVSKKSGVQNVYVRQTFDNIEIYNGVGNFSIKGGKIIHAGLRFQNKINDKVNTSIYTLSPKEAIESAAQQLNLVSRDAVRLKEKLDDKNFLFNGTGYSTKDIPVKLMFFALDNENQDIRLVWDLSIYEYSKDHWWSVRVDAVTGEIIDKIDWIVECTFEACDHSETAHSSRRPISETVMGPVPAPPPGTDQYRVYAIPAESPNHAPRTLVVGPSNAIASPFGWHDDNGVAGNEYTITQGNNVRATEDVNDNGGVGFMPSGGTTLNFDFPLNFNNAPSTYQSAAITNLFYMNNVMHDIWYQYGFDETSGNFQENNYGNGGAASDMVFAEAQDGGGTNNANFATPPDGQNPTMQMYLWSASTAQYLLTVNTPAGIAGQYQGVEAGFGPGLPVTPITQNFVLVNDGTALPDEGCNALINGAAMNGKIALVKRGSCNFITKVLNAQNAGAVAVIVINNAPGAPFSMGGTSAAITIPSIMISQADGALILAQLAGGVNGTLQSAGGGQMIDGDLDNGIIAHEYGHGISTRLTGGPSNSGCLSNAEQMGEGWSDWFGLMLTIEPGDTATDVRGIGTFAIGEPTTGDGIRPTPYSTDFAINPSTYGTTNNTGAISQPHGIGYVWCTMLWDLNWAFINQYGYSSDLYNGTAGNNIAMNLVIEALKLQPCSPGFVDGRDAILAADVALYSGANQCLIWSVFANRGLGFSASQGSTSSRSDQVEAFDLPSSCIVPTVPPGASFSIDVNDCSGEVSFTDNTTQNPNAWNWTFGDGATSTLQHPIHTYVSNGTYTVTLIAQNVVGSDTISFPVTVNMLTVPLVANQTICANQSTSITASASNSVIWYDNTGTTPLDTTATFVTPVLTSNTTYMLENVALEPVLNVGPLNASFGTSGYHNQPTNFTLNFTSNTAQGFTILSVWVDANTTGPRTINVWNDINATGTIIGSTTVNITTTGGQRIPINIDVPGLGSYSIGGTNMDMRRNNASAVYPYSLPGIVDIIGAYVTAPVDFYYYYYDWEVQEIACRSAMVPVTVTVNNGNNVVQNVTACVQYTWPASGAILTNSGTYISNLTNSFGCDSIVTLNLTIGPNSLGSETVSTCNSFTWPANGATYTSSGSYTTTLSSSQLCDSIVTLNLTINQPNSGSESVNVCNSFSWPASGLTYNSSGTYTINLTNALGCDSLATLNLTIATPTTGSETITACNSFTWPANGTTYGGTGSYSTVLQNAQGCDSTVTLNLTINSSSTNTISTSACDSYFWSATGNTYTSSGQYNVTFQNASGCDSIVTLDLTIDSDIGSSSSATACQSYFWPTDGNTYTSSGIYTSILSSANGCDSTVTLNLTVNSVTSGISLIGDITLQASTNGASYQWINCDGNAPIAGANNQTFVATANGNYAVITTVNGCSDTSECLTVAKVGILENDFGSLFKVYPNPTEGIVQVELGAKYAFVSTKLFDMKGRLIRSDEFENTPSFNIEIEGESGVYYLEIVSNEGERSYVKLVKN